MTQKEAIEYAINLAKKANENEIRPNPFVGAVIVDHQGQLIGEGYHQKLGGPHAEVYAIEQALYCREDNKASTAVSPLRVTGHFTPGNWGR